MNILKFNIPLLLKSTMKESKNRGENQVSDVEEKLEKVFQNAIVEKDQKENKDSICR